MAGKRQPAQIKTNKATWTLKASEKIENFKVVAEQKAIARFAEMKENILAVLRQHNNTLVVWALGNDGESIDEDPFWQGLLSEESILAHTLLIYGIDRHGKRHADSNFTENYFNHSLGKLYQVKV